MPNVISLADYIRNHPVKSQTHARTLVHLDNKQSMDDELFRLAREILSRDLEEAKPRAKRKARSSK